MGCKKKKKRTRVDRTMGSARGKTAKQKYSPILALSRKDTTPINTRANGSADTGSWRSCRKLKSIQRKKHTHIHTTVDPAELHPVATLLSKRSFQLPRNKKTTTIYFVLQTSPHDHGKALPKDRYPCDPPTHFFTTTAFLLNFLWLSSHLYLPFH